METVRNGLEGWKMEKIPPEKRERETPSQIVQGFLIVSPEDVKRNMKTDSKLIGLELVVQENKLCPRIAKDK